MDAYIQPSRAAHRRIAQDYALDVAEGLRTEALSVLIEAEGLILGMRGAGAGNLSINALKDALIDCFRDIQGGINKALDGEGLATDRHQLDLSELADA